MRPSAPFKLNAATHSGRTSALVWRRQAWPLASATCSFGPHPIAHKPRRAFARAESSPKPASRSRWPENSEVVVRFTSPIRATFFCLLFLPIAWAACEPLEGCEYTATCPETGGAGGGGAASGGATSGGTADASGG